MTRTAAVQQSFSETLGWTQLYGGNYCGTSFADNDLGLIRNLFHVAHLSTVLRIAVCYLQCLQSSHKNWYYF